MSKSRTSAEIAALIPCGATVAITGAGGGLVEPDGLLAAIESKFLSSGRPRDLTVVHAQGLGDGEVRGLNRLAHRGLVRKVIGAHWAWSPRMQALARDEAIEAYALPGGAIQHLIREVAAGRPGLITPIGLNTFVDPRVSGGRMNSSCQADLTEIVLLDGREYLRYLPFPIDIAILRGSEADDDGALSLDSEGAELDGLVLAMAAHNSGGKVLVQCHQLVASGGLPARSVRVPGALVDALLVSSDQPQSYNARYDAALAGRVPRRSLPVSTEEDTPQAPLERRIVGARAVEELEPGNLVSFGIGYPDEVAHLAYLARERTPFTATLDHGHYGGEALKGTLFGFVRAGEAMIDSPSQFDFYSGGGIDIAYVGFGEIDEMGNVNVSKLNGKIVGPGGFIEITQGARVVVFCGAFENNGLKVDLEDHRLKIKSVGSRPKLVREVEQVTFSGERARRLGQRIIYVTERCVFELSDDGLLLSEVAPGLRIKEDIIDRMAFAPRIAPSGPKVMSGIFG